MKKIWFSRKLRLESLEERTLLAVVAGSEAHFIPAGLPAATEAVAWVVNTNGDPSEWDTTDTTLSLREAILSASAGDTITFDSSLAGQTITLSGTQLSIDKGIAIDASGIGGITIDANSASCVFDVSGGTEEAPVELVGLTITGGKANYGGGIYADTCSTLTLTNCTVSRNTASGPDSSYGGGIYANTSSTLTLMNCTVSRNTASGPDSSYGGGIYANTSSTLTLMNCTVAGNRATCEDENDGDGGGIYAKSGSTLTLTNCTVTGNSAYGYNNGGGGIYAYYGTLTLTNCTISGNDAYCGGGIYATLGTLTMTNCTISGNKVNNGGGIYATLGTLTMTNCTISGNKAGYGGGISSSFTKTYIYNTIIAGNTASSSSSGNDIDSDSGSSYAYYTLSSYTDWTESSDCLTYDSTLPLFTDAAGGDYSLAVNSQAIDKGNNDYITGYDVDLAGKERIVNGTVDLGAYEFHGGETPSVVVTTNQDIVDLSDNLISLREAILLYADEGDTITFDSSLAGQTITLSGTELSIEKGITIDASGIGGMTIDANGENRVFSIYSESEDHVVELIGLTVTGGSAEDGGGIGVYSGMVTLTNCTVTGNTASSVGGGISTFGTLTLTNCVITGNTANYNEEYDGYEVNAYGTGGGIHNAGTLRLSGSIVSGNVANFGGGIFSVGDATLDCCSVTENSAAGFVHSYSEDSSYYEVTAQGGGIVSMGGVLEIIDSIISGNSTADVEDIEYDGDVEFDIEIYVAGGGIYSSGELIMVNSLVVENSADGIYDAGEESYSGGEGGGIYSEGISMLTNCTVSGNTANYGGGISNHGDFTLSNCDIAGNTSSDSGGGIYHNDGSLTMMNCTVTGNKAIVGGGIEATGNMTLTDSIIADNTASYMGGGISCYGEDLLISETIITENRCKDDDCEFTTSGGGIHCEEGNLTIINSEISNNTADFGAGIENDDLNELELVNCLIAGNTSSYWGGGIYNTANDYHPGASLRMINCTVSGNTAGAGGGIYNTQSIYLYNTIVALNIAATGSDVREVKFYNPSSGTKLDYYSYSYNTLSSYTGWTESANCYLFDSVSSLFTDAASGDYTLVSGSLAINRGNNSYIEGYEADLAGNVRIVDGTVDIGAYEYQEIVEWETPSVVVTTNQDIVDLTDNLISLREAVFYADEGDTITFDSSLAGQTITLSGTELTIEKGITIDASGIGGMTIDANSASRVLYVSGGSEETPVELIGLTITGGYVSDYNDGGGIYTYGSTLILTNCTVTGNVSGYGGGISADSGTLTLTNCTVSENTGSYQGGGIFNYASLTMTNCLIEGNSTNFYCAGGVYNYYGTLTMTNCTVTGNTAGGNSGGVSNWAGTLTMTNCTVAGNNSGNQGGGISSYGSSLSETYLYNTIIAHNTYNGIENDVNYECGSLYAYNTLSSFTGWTESSDCLSYDSALPLFADAANGDYTLAENSQAIDKGNNGYVTTDTDLAGNTRIVNGTVDLGAYEYQTGGGETAQLAAPTILTGNRGVYVSAGANRHQITWNAVDHAAGYELAYSADGSTWTSVNATGTSAVVTGLAYGAAVTYRVRALGAGSYTDSDWSAVKSFAVCPVDINGDGDISGGDRVLMVGAWLSEEGDDEYQSYCDVNSDGDVTGADRAYLVNNWLLSLEDDAEDFVYPPAKISDAFFAEYGSADLGVDLEVF